MRIVQYTYPNPRSLSPAFGAFVRSPWAGLENGIDRLFAGAFADGSATRARFPVVLDEDNANAYLRAELPGVPREAIGVELTDGVLTVSVSSKEKNAEGKEECSCTRSVEIPEDVQADKVSAAYENGLLTVTLPKREPAKPQKINIEVK